MKKLENLGVQELNAKMASQIDGGCPNSYACAGGGTPGAMLDAVVDAGQWVLGLFAGIGDGINAGMDD